MLSKQQVLPKSEQKRRSNETIIPDTKIGNYFQRSRLTAENQDMLLRGRWIMEAQREVKGQSEWMMKVTDKWGQRKRMLFTRREEVQTQWVLGSKRKRMLFGRTQEQQTKLVVEVTDKWDAKRKMMLFCRTEEQQKHWLVEVTDKCGAKIKRMLFGRSQEEQTQWVVGMTDKCRGQRERVR